MLDDTPEVKWSNAWWGRIIFGILAPIASVIACVWALTSDKAFLISAQRGRYQFIEVHGRQATLMAVAYLGAGVSSFAYNYARTHARLGFYYEMILAVGVMATMVCLVWACFLLV